MELMPTASEQCRVSGEMVGVSASSSPPAFSMGDMEGGAWAKQVIVIPTGGQHELVRRSIYQPPLQILVAPHQPYLSHQRFVWSLPEVTEEPASESLRPPADASQESIQFDPPVGAWVRGVSERFDYLISLPPGWDGHQAVPIKDQHILAAGRFLSAVMTPETAAPAIVPTADGGVQVEWHQGGVDVEVLFSDCEDVSLYVHDLASRNEWEGPAIDGFSEFELASRLSA